MKKSLRKRLTTVLVVMFAMTSLFSTSVFAEGNNPEDAIKLEGDNFLTEEEVIKFSSDAVLKAQQAKEEAILAEFKKGNFTLKNPFVKVNPFDVAPLSALVIFDTEKETKVDLLVKGKGSNVDIKHSFNQYSTHHEIPVYGLYADFNNSVKITTTTRDGLKVQENISIKTEPLPTNLDTSFNPNYTVKDEAQMADGLTFLCKKTIVAYDKNGDIRCVLTNGAVEASPIRRLANGHILTLSEKNLRKLYYQGGFVEIDLMGKIHKEYLRNGVHHDVRQLSNGNFLVVTEKPGRDTTEDFIVEIDGKTGMKVREWDLKEIMKVNHVANPSYNYNKHDWLHINSIWPVPGEDAILFSGRHQDGFFKLDLGKKEIVWAMTAPDTDFSDEFSGKLLTPVGDNFEYVWGQHAISMLPDGRIFVFDNGNGRSKGTDFMNTKDPRNYSRAVIYQIDQENMTVEQLWQYGKERGFELFSRYICDVDYLGPNHYLINFGGASDAATGKPKATVVEIKNDQVVSELKLDTNTYRVERMQAYDFDKEYELTKHEGQQLGVLYTTEDNTVAR